MWTYIQTTGHLIGPNGSLAAVGYSGRGDGLNNAAMQDVPRVGPIPAGTWTVGAPCDDPKCGPYTLALTPAAGTETFGRTAFRVHGDLIGHVGEHLASEGCIILALSARTAIWESGDHLIRVIAAGGQEDGT